MRLFGRKDRTSGHQDIRTSGNQETRKSGTLIPRSSDPLIPPTARSKRLFRLVTPVFLALFAATLWLVPQVAVAASCTAAVLSSPQNFITGGAGQTNWTTETSGAT